MCACVGREKACTRSVLYVCHHEKEKGMRPNRVGREGVRVREGERTMFVVPYKI